MKKFSKEIQIALVAIVGVVVLFFGLQYLKGKTLFSTDNNYYVKFSDVSGLSAASPIYANGFKVGVVEDIVFDYQHQSNIVARIGIDNQLAVPADSRAEILTDLMGNVKVEQVIPFSAVSTKVLWDRRQVWFRRLSRCCLNSTLSWRASTCCWLIPPLRIPCITSIRLLRT